MRITGGTSFLPGNNRVRKVDIFSFLDAPGIENGPDVLQSWVAVEVGLGDHVVTAD